MNCPSVLSEGVKAYKRCLHFFAHLVCIGLDGCNNLMFLAAYPPMVATLLWLRKMCIWLRKDYVGHHKNGGGMATPPPMLALVHYRSILAASEFLQMVAHNFVVHCRMDLPGPTASVGTRTDYSVGPWDYPACATRHLKVWSTRTTRE
jgi:hypothetical protein